jgi:hypothetical protein
MTYQTQRDLAAAGGFLIGLAIAALIAGSCSCAPYHPHGVCQTPCGMVLVSAPPAQDATYDGGKDNDAYLPWWSCANLSAIEAQSLQALKANAAAYDDRFEPSNACSALENVTLAIRPEKRWYDGSDAGYFGNNEWVWGLTSCRGLPAPSIQIANREPAEGTLTHEMAHAIQGCHAKGPLPLVGQDPDYAGDSDQAHLNWTRYGVYAAETQVAILDAAERLRREDALSACDGGAVCMQSFDAGGIP